MSKSLFSITVLPANGAAVNKNVLAQDAGGKSAIQSAIDAAITQLDGALQTAMQLDGASIDYTIPAAISPATNGTPKSVYRVQFQAGSGPNSSTPAAMRILAWPQTSGGVMSSAPDLAIQTALAYAPVGAIANGVVLVGAVDIDATV